MKKYKFVILLTALFCLCSMAVQAEKLTDFSGSGVVSIDIPDGYKNATRNSYSSDLLKMFNTEELTLAQNMIAGNLYLLSFGNDGTSIIQYNMSSQDNPGMPEGNINSLSDEGFSGFTTNLKNILEADGVTKIITTSPFKSGAYSFLCLDGSTSDEVNGTTLYFRTYATVQNDKLVMFRAMNYSATEFSSQQKSSLDSIAQSIVFEQPSQSAKSADVKNNAESVQTESSKTEEKQQSPAKNEPAKQGASATAPQVQNQVSDIPQSQNTAPTKENAVVTEPEDKESNQVEEDDEKAEEDNKKGGSPIIPVIAVIVIIAVVVTIIAYIKKRKLYSYK